MIPIPSSTFNNPIFTGLKPITKTVTASNVSGSYSQVFSDDRIIAHMAVTKVEVADPSIFHGRLGFTPAAGQVTVYCSEVVGETTVKMFFEKTADDPTAVSSTEFDMLANRIGDLTNLTTTAKENVVAALNEVDSKIENYTLISSSKSFTSLDTLINPDGEYTCPYDGWYILLCNANGTGTTAEFTEKSSGLPLIGTTNNLFAPVLLKAGTVIKARNITGQSYMIRGYVRL